MSKTSVTVAGVTFKNPVIPASGTFGFGREYDRFYDISLLGGLCTKGLTLLPREGNVYPRIAETPMGMLNSVGLQNPGVEHFLQCDLPWLKTKDTRVIANVAGSTLEDYVKICEKVSVDGVDMVELNISCPNVKAGGMSFGVCPTSVEEVTRAAKKACGKPLIVKLTPNVSAIADNAIAVEAGGADAISLINTVGGMAVDYRTRRPILGVNAGGLSGACVKPIALKMVWQCKNAVSIPIIGVGGIMSYTDVLEFMICGAAAVEVGSANIYDPMACATIVADLERYVAQSGVSLETLIGTLIAND